MQKNKIAAVFKPLHERSVEKRNEPFVNHERTKICVRNKIMAANQEQKHCKYVTRRFCFGMTQSTRARRAGFQTMLLLINNQRS